MGFAACFGVLGVLSLGPAFLLVGVWSSAYLIGLPLISEIDVLNLRSTALGYLPTLLMLAGFTALYVVVPNSTVPLRHGLLGGALTTLVFQLAFEGFATASQYIVTTLCTALLLPCLHFCCGCIWFG